MDELCTVRPEKADVWAAGCVLLLLLAVEALRALALFESVQTDAGEYPSECPSEYSPSTPGLPPSYPPRAHPSTPLGGPF